MASDDYDVELVYPTLPEGQVLPLNSKRLMATYVKAIADSMRLPTKASADEVLQLIEGKLSEDGREPRNVQVIIQRPTEEGAGGDAHIRLFVVDETGVITEARVAIESEQRAESLGVEPREEEVESTHALSEVGNEESTYDEDDDALAYMELQQKQMELDAALEELEELRRKKEEAREALTARDAQIERLTEQLGREKERYKQVWRMNCEQLIEHDAMLASKDEKIVELQERLSSMQSSARFLTMGPGESGPGSSSVGGTSDPGESGPRSASSHSRSAVVRFAQSSSTDMLPQEHRETEGRPSSPRAQESAMILSPAGSDSPIECSLPTGGRQTNLDGATGSDRGRRRGKAPPVDPFTGENPEIRFKDWLPALVRASRWNDWSPEENLLQLAGYLRGRALQEWDLLQDSDKSTWDQAVASLRSRLDPGTRVMAAQDFRHTTQKDTEMVPDFIRRLERTFRVAYGRDNLSNETRDTFLYGQLQDGLRTELMQNPAVSGAQTYKELCMAARNEERRVEELQKRKLYRSTAPSEVMDTRKTDNQKKSEGRQRSFLPRKGGGTTSKPQQTRPQTSFSPRSGGDTRLCYNCGKPGHLAKDCKASKTESQGRSSKKDTQSVKSTRQITSTTISTDCQREDPLSFLQSDSDQETEEDVKSVRVTDKGSQPRGAQVQVQGVSAWGVVDTGADITIMGKELFKTVATVNKLKKSQFKKPDKVPRVYDKRSFTLDGMMELEIAFADRVMVTSVYVKMDAPDQLLLSEGVCHQLGIVKYHATVRPWSKRHSSGREVKQDSRPEPETERDGATVPMVCVQLLQSVAVLPNRCTSVQVTVPQPNQLKTCRPLVVDPVKSLAEGIHVEPCLLTAREGKAHIQLSNHTGFTRHLEEGTELGTAFEVEDILSGTQKTAPSSGQSQPDPSVNTIQTQDVEWRKNKVYNLFSDTISLSPEEKQTFCDLLAKHHLAFVLEDGERGETDLVQLEIDTGDALPKKQRPRRMPYAVREEVARELQKMQDAGVIQPSNSPWASPVVLVRKKDGSHQFCVDYRELNGVTKQDTFPLPRVDDLLDQLGEARYFSTLDLAAGYWQIKVHPDSRQKTAFVTHQGLHEFTVMPFGLTNAPSVFQRLMQQVLMGLNPASGPDFVSVYIDDVLIFFRTLTDHLEHITAVLRRLIEVGLKLKPVKCHFLRQEVGFLGHVISPEGLKTSEHHILAIKDFPVPTNVREVRQFMGMASYYRRFVRNFAKVAQPLHALTTKGVSFEWTESCQQAFSELKKRLCEAPILTYPSFSKEFVLETDASIKGIGSVLSQPQEDGKLHPVAFASRALSPAEKNYSITDLETLVVVWAVSHFRAYLYGQRVTVYTDHAAVKAVLQNPGASGRHARWWTKVHGSGIQEVRIVYRAGKENTVADALSRSPHGLAPTEGIAEFEVQVAEITSQNTASIAEHISSLLESDPAEGEVEIQPSMATEQRKDSNLASLIAYIKDGELPKDAKIAQKIAAQATQFVILDELLYFLDARRDSRKRVAVPTHLKETLMAEAHGGLMAGHFSTNRLYNSLARTWWWEGMYRDVDNHCKSCPQCASVTGAGRPGRPPLKPIPVSRPFQIIGVDVMDLPRTEQGNKHVIVFQDFLTKWPLVFAMPDQKTQCIVKLLAEEIIPLFGVPEALLSDRGTNLLSHLMRDVCALLGIEKLNTTAYHPQGLTERFNRTLKTMLRKHASKFGLQWDRYLHCVLWAYRNTPHNSTNEKPSFLLFGMDCRQPTEAALLPPTTVEPTEVEDYRQELILGLSSARNLAVQAIQDAQTRYKTNYDRKSRVSEYQIGDWILIRFPQEETGANRKLSRPWYGPFRVTDCDDTGVTATRVYSSQSAPIRVHQSRVTRCPPGFPAGYWWYGDKRSGPGRPPKWIDRYVARQSASEISTESPQTQTNPRMEESRSQHSPSECEQSDQDCPIAQTEVDIPREFEAPPGEEDISLTLEPGHVPEADHFMNKRSLASGDIKQASRGEMSPPPTLSHNRGDRQKRNITPSKRRRRGRSPDTQPVSDTSYPDRGSRDTRSKDTRPLDAAATRTRTRAIAPPDRLMKIRSGRAF